LKFEVYRLGFEVYRLRFTVYWLQISVFSGVKRNSAIALLITLRQAFGLLCQKFKPQTVNGKPQTPNGKPQPQTNKFHIFAPYDTRKDSGYEGPGTGPEEVSLTSTTVNSK